MRLLVHRSYYRIHLKKGFRSRINLALSLLFSLTFWIPLYIVPTLLIVVYCSPEVFSLFFIYSVCCVFIYIFSSSDLCIARFAVNFEVHV